MEFRILGPLEAWHEGREVSLGGPKPRALLAVLLLHANEVVSRDQLIDELWGEDSTDRRRRRAARQRLSPPQGAPPRHADDEVAGLRPPDRAGRPRSPSLRAPGGGGTEPARPSGWRPTRRSGSGKRSRSGEARRSWTSRTNASRKQPSLGSTRSGSQPSSCGSTPTWRWAGTTSSSPSSRRSSPITRYVSASADVS